eukprot:1157989-Pelagomonas_calceolata.AAC.5
MCVGLAILDGSKQAALAPQEPIKFCACGWAPSVMLFALAKVPVMQLFSKRWWSGLALFAFAQSLPQHCAFVAFVFLFCRQPAGYLLYIARACNAMAWPLPSFYLTRNKDDKG